MPGIPERKKVVNTSPTPGLIERLFGSTTPPNMQAGIDIARKENPNMGNVESYGPLSRFMQSSAQAYTSPGRSIYLNPNQMQGQSPQDIADIITHEQEHVNQMTKRGHSAPMEFMSEIMSGAGIPYAQRPDEMEAYNAERVRRDKMNRGQSAIPGFNGEFYTPHDINLPLKTGPTSAKLKQLVK